MGSYDLFVTFPFGNYLLLFLIKLLKTKIASYGSEFASLG